MDRAPLSANLVYPIALLVPICLLSHIYWYIFYNRCSQALYEAWHKLQRIRGHGKAIDDTLEKINNDSAADMRASRPVLDGYDKEITDAQNAFDKADANVVDASNALEAAKNEVNVCDANLTKAKNEVIVCDTNLAKAKTEVGFCDVKLQEQETIKREMQKKHRGKKNEKRKRK